MTNTAVLKKCRKEAGLSVAVMLAAVLFAAVAVTAGAAEKSSFNQNVQDAL
jgi:hypothetical protein